MSEDSLKIKFISENLSDVNHREELENIYWKHIPKDEIGKGTSIEYIRNKAIFYSAFYSTDAALLDPLVAELEKNGAKELMATARYDRVGEEMYYVRRGERLLGFETIEEMTGYLKDAAKGVSNIDVNYGKNNRENTILIRLHVKAKGKRKKYSSFLYLLKNL